jgi:hypothetical protein
MASLALLIAAAAWWALYGRPLPPTNADVVTLARFVNTSRFSHLQEKQRRPYAKTLRNNLNQLAEAHAAGRVSDAEYEQAFLCGWMDRQIDHMHDFYRQPPGTREQYLRAEHTAKLKNPKGSAAPVPPRDAEAEFVEKWISGWDADKRAEWEEFRQASKRAKQAASPNVVRGAATRSAAGV